MTPERMKPDGFTLMELLTVVAIIAILAVLAIPVMTSVSRKGSMSREISAARQVISAYTSYAAEHNGELMPGFGNFPATDEKGQALKSPINYRYPWRLAPYINYDMRVLWGNNNDDQLRKLAEGPRDAYIYGVSVQPAFGINATFVGGDYQNLPPDNPRAQERYGPFCVTQIVQAKKPQWLIVFASAATEFQGERLPGFFKIEAPELGSRKWDTKYSRNAPPERFGYVDFRYDDKAVVAMLDGHIELMDFKTLDDMRRWSNQAGNANNDKWRLGSSDEPQVPSSGSGNGTSTNNDDVIDGNPTNTPPSGL